MNILLSRANTWISNATCRWSILVLSGLRWTTGVTSGAGTAYPSGAPEFTPGF